MQRETLMGSPAFSFGDEMTEMAKREDLDLDEKAMAVSDPVFGAEQKRLLVACRTQGGNRTVVAGTISK
jgi:hypothetical protein